MHAYLFRTISDETGYRTRDAAFRRPRSVGLLHAMGLRSVAALRLRVLCAGVFTQSIVETRRSEQHVLQTLEDGLGAERLSAHRGVSFQCAHHGVQDFGLQVRRVRE